MVRDGRLQTPKKRTERSYLRGDATVSDDLPESADDSMIEDDAVVAEDMAAADAAISDAEPMAASPTSAFTAPEPVAEPVAAAAPTRTPSSRLPTAVRAIQQQGVRKRRDVDLGALAVRDTNYAVHELRRIAILTVMVIISLVVLTFVLR